MSDYRDPELYGFLMATKSPAFGDLWGAFDQDNTADILEHGGNGYAGGPPAWFQEQTSYRVAQGLLALPEYRRLVSEAMDIAPGRPGDAARLMNVNGRAAEVRGQFVGWLQETGFVEGLTLLNVNDDGEQ